jgi:hypothetical protein
MFALVTACSNRKRVVAPEALRARTLPSGTLGETLSEWVDRLSTTHPMTKARDLYMGRSFQEALSTARTLRSSHHVVSAGLGFVDVDTHIPSYSLTIAPGNDDSILTKVTEQTSVQAWWLDLCRQSPFSSRADLRKCELVVVALPREYLRAAASILERAVSVERLRILSRGDDSHVPSALKTAIINYDDRLDGDGSPNAGTMTDFANRSARHFAENIVLSYPKASAAAHQNLVDASLRAYPPRQIPKRERATDQEIRALILANWSEVQGQSGKMLRHIRDRLGVACEQGRFKDLFHQVASKRSAP